MVLQHHFLHKSPHYNENLIGTAAMIQDQIGWTHIFHGRISKSWIDAQVYYLERKLSPRSVALWAKNFILQLYKFSYSMWRKRCAIAHEQEQEVISSKELETYVRL